MIGPRNLKDLRGNVTEEFADEGLDANRWLAERIQKLEGKKKADQCVLETLNFLRDALNMADKPTSAAKRP